MKKILIPCLFFSTFSFTQITINSTDFLTAGDSVLSSIGELNDVTNSHLITTGPNSNWNFSFLDPNYQVTDHNRLLNSPLESLTFGFLAPTQYQASYVTDLLENIPSSLSSLINNYVNIKITDYIRLTPDSLTIIGNGLTINGFSMPMAYSKIEKNYDFPIQYNNSTFSRGEGEVDVNPFYNAKYKVKKNHTSLVDGWGVITTPYGTFNALRIKHEVSRVDSFLVAIPNLPLTWIAIPTLTRQYEWWTNNEKAPILKISTIVIDGNEIISFVKYKDIVRDFSQSANLNELNKGQISVFPNPVYEDLNIVNDGTVEKIEVTDLQGKRVLSFENLNLNLNKIDISNLEKGSYIIQIETTNDKIIQKIEKM